MSPREPIVYTPTSPMSWVQFIVMRRPSAIEGKGQSKRVVVHPDSTSALRPNYA